MQAAKKTESIEPSPGTTSLQINVQSHIAEQSAIWPSTTSLPSATWRRSSQQDVLGVDLIEYTPPTSPFVFDPKKERWNDFVKRHRKAYEDERPTDGSSDDAINESYRDPCRSLRNCIRVRLLTFM
jgi:hypothetical protein